MKKIVKIDILDDLFDMASEDLGNLVTLDDFIGWRKQWAGVLEMALGTGSEAFKQMTDEEKRDMNLGMLRGDIDPNDITIEEEPEHPPMTGVGSNLIH